MAYSQYFKKLYTYSDSWSLAEIVVFEQLLQLHGKGGERIVVNKQLLQKGLHLKRHALDSALGKFEELGYIVPCNDAERSPREYHLNRTKILEDVSKIYNFSSLTGLEREEAIRRETAWLRRELGLGNVFLGQKR